MRVCLAVLTALSMVAVQARSARASCIPGFEYAIFAKNQIQLQSGAKTDSYNSSMGYASSVACAGASIATNATSGGIVQIQDSSTKVCGDAKSGAGSTATSVITLSGGATVTGTRSAQTANETLSAVTSPTLTNGSPLSPSYSSGTNTLTPERKYDDVTCSGGTLNLSAGSYVVKKLQISSGCTLKLTSGVTRLYFTSEIQIQGSVVNSTAVPGNFQVFGVGSSATQVQIQTGASVAMAVYAPAAQCQLQGNSHFYGAMVCDKAQVQSGAQVHYDTQLKTLGGAGFKCDPGVCIQGFDYAAFGDLNVKVGGNSSTDSFDSTVASYAGSKSTTSGGNVGTNATSCSSVTLGGASTSIGGNIKYGPGGPSTCSYSPSTVYGSGGPNGAALDLPSVTIPATVGTNQGNVSANATLSPATNNTWGSVTVGNGKTLTLGAGTYIFDNMDLKGSVVVTGAVKIYFKCAIATQAIKTTAGGLLNSTSPPTPTNLMIFMGPNCATASFSGGANVSFAVYAPDTKLDFSGGSDVYGAFVGKEVEFGGGVDVHYDRALANYGTSSACSTTTYEVSRASPIVATINNTTAIVQGTFESPTGLATEITSTTSVATWSFPYIKGHMRARDASTVTTSASTFSSGTILFDAGATGKIPSVTASGCASMNGSCRNVFTVLGSPNTAGLQFKPTHVQLKTGTNATSIGAQIVTTGQVAGINTHYDTIITKILQGGLGGVDRSTVAVIEASPIAGVATRPKMVYFGAADGMIHAVCAQTGGTTPTGSNLCPSLGTELWAFLPRVQLPLIRQNKQKVDGSVRVVDVFGDFDATGLRGWRTVAIFQTGYAVGATPAAYAIDVTDPANPTVLWEYTPPSATATHKLGTGLTVAAGPVLIGGQQKNVAVLQTNNSGTAGAGVVAVALDIETGAELWKFGNTYADSTISATGIPGGAVGVDLTEQGLMTDIVMGDLYGSLWRLDASTGQSRNGTNTPLFRFSTASSAKRPIGAPVAVYSDGNAQYAAFASGGYADTSTSASLWSNGTQYLMAVKLAGTGATIDETGTACAGCALAVKSALTTGDRNFSQVLVVGTQLFLTTDSENINSSTYGSSTASTGRVTTVNMASSNATTSVVVAAGAGSLASSGVNLYASSSAKQQKLADANGSTGAAVDLTTAALVARLLWLRSE